VEAEGAAVERAVLVDLLERPLAGRGEPTRGENAVVLDLRPFEMVTLRIPRG
jgi:alpha-mannosidase